MPDSVRRWRNVWIALIACNVAGVGPAAAAGYPERPVRMVVPFAPGGTTDFLARIVGARLYETMGVPVIVDNRPGAGTNLGAEIVAKAVPDGHTLLMATNALAINVSLYRNLPYDLRRDLLPVGLVASVPLILVVNQATPVASVAEFIAHAKARPGQLNFGSSGNGTATHMAAALFNSMAGISAVHVLYRGGGPAVADLAAGRLQYMVSSAPETLPFVTSGKLRALAVTRSTRSPVLPNLPTITESGLPGYEFLGWNGLFAPARTPAAIVARLNTELNRILDTPAIIERLTAAGAEPVPGSPMEMQRRIATEIPQWAKLIAETGTKLD